MAPAQTKSSSTLQQPAKAAAWSGWGQVPGNGFTPSGPAATVYNGTSYLFVRGTDNKIYQNVLTNTHWSGWRQVPGNGLTLSRPGATVYQNRLYLFVQGTDSRIYQNVLTKPLERLAAGTRQRLDPVWPRSHGLSKQVVPVRARDRQQDLPERAHEHPLERLGRGTRQRPDPVWPRSHGLSKQVVPVRARDRQQDLPERAQVA